MGYAEVVSALDTLLEALSLFSKPMRAEVLLILGHAGVERDGRARVVYRLCAVVVDHYQRPEVHLNIAAPLAGAS